MNDSRRRCFRVAEACAIMILLPCAPIVEAQTRIEDAVEITAVAIRHSPTTKGYATVEFEMRNRSPQVITAWSARVVARYADGYAESKDAKVDEVAYLLPPQKHLAWKPGSVRKGRVDLFVGALNDLPISAEVMVQMLIFENRTAVGDETEIWSVKKLRMTMAKDEEEKANQIDEALSSQDPKGRLRAVLDRRQTKNADSVRQVYGMLEYGTPLSAVRVVAAAFREYQKLLAHHSDVHLKEK
ncbi:MAG: hypothetical protein ACUVS7_01750 [Bryobacteraceae bacterium]